MFKHDSGRVISLDYGSIVWICMAGVASIYIIAHAVVDRAASVYTDAEAKADEAKANAKQAKYEYKKAELEARATAAPAPEGTVSVTTTE